MHVLNLNPSDKVLRQFSEFGMFLLGLVAAPWMLYRGHTTLAVAFWLTAIVLRLLALLSPRLVKWPFIVLSVITWPIGFVVSHVALGVVYYLVFTPVALFFRLIGRDALKRRFEPEAASYWEAYNPERDAARYLKQF